MAPCPRWLPLAAARSVPVGSADAPTSLFAAALAILAVDPAQVADPGFLFSFLCTAALLALPRGLSAWRRVVLTSVAAWAASVPLTAVYFGQIVPVALLCNLAVLKLAKWTVWTALAMLFASFALPAAVATAAGSACAAVTALMELAARLAAAVPGAVWHVHPWPPWAVLAWYAALAPLAVLLRRRAVAKAET